MEAQILSFISENNQTSLEEITPKMSFGDKTILSILTTLVSKKVLKLVGDIYSYNENKKRNNIILHGNLLLPVTIIKKSDRILVCRGKWYEFDVDFDISTIIWNVDLSNVNGKKTSLIELIENQALSVPVAKIKQVKEYEQLRDKIIPYNIHVDLLLKVIGEEKTSIEIILKQDIKFDKTPNSDFYLFREFRIPSQISTDELINCLKTPVDKRDFTQIKIQTIIQISDIINNDNAIPINVEFDKITYIKIKRDRQKLVLEYKTCDSNGVVTDLTSEEYFEISDGITIIEKNLTTAKKLLSNANILLENV
jgi:DNA-binding Lrp family transcriptional regulator